MSKKQFLLLFFLGVKIYSIQGQTTEKLPFKRKYGMSSNFGIMLPLGRFSEKNTSGGNLGLVIESDITPSVFVRLTWDNFNFSFAQQTKIGSQNIDINGSNDGDAVYLSSGYYKNVGKWRCYTFTGLGFTTLDDPKIENQKIDGVNYTYLSNQNANSLMFNLGLGTGFKISSNERINLEINSFYLANIGKNTFFLSAQLGYKMFFRSSN